MLARAAIIAIAGFLAFCLMLTSPFKVMDDRASIVENPDIKSTENIPALFKEGYFGDQSYYRPLVNLSFMAEYHAFKLNPFFYHLDNLFLHLLNAILVFLLVARLLNNDTMGFWVGFLFAIHPVQWEAVCNVPGRAILLSAFFVLSSFLLFLQFYQSRRWYLGIPVFLTFFFGLLCKESAGVLPLVVLVYLWMDKSGSWLQKFKFLWPLAIGVVVYLGLRYYLGITHLHQAGQPLALVLGFITFLHSVIINLRLFLFPVDLHYDRSLPFIMSLTEPRAWGTCIFWVIVSGALVFYYRRLTPFLLFLMAWFFIELLPVSQLVTSIGTGAGHVSTAEHFLYVAAVPVLIGLVMAFYRVYQLNQEKNVVKPVLLKFAAGAFLVFFFLTSIEQSVYASNEFNMLKRSLSFEPNNARVQSAMGMLSVFRDDMIDAEKRFRRAIQVDPLNAVYHIRLGVALCKQGRWEEGLQELKAFDPGRHKDLVERQIKEAMEHVAVYP